MSAHHLNEAAPVEEILSHIGAVRQSSAAVDDLVALLAESAPLYGGRRAAEVERLRGHILASFERVGLPLAAVVFVQEELQSGDNAYTVAAAARALRGAKSVPAQSVALLLQAIDRFAAADDIVDFGDLANAGTPTTVLIELFRTLAWVGPRASADREALRALAERHAASFSADVRVEMRRALESVSRADGPAADCCCGAVAESSPGETSTGETSTAAESTSIALLENLELQDQDGVKIIFGQLLGGRPSILTFFYTRCMVPEKCSLTIAKLGRLQRKIADSHLGGQVNIAAITYDPAFDLPPRLRAYGADRGMIFDAHNRLLRTKDIATLRRHFDLGVGFGPVTVNRHRLELFVLDRLGGVAATFTRLQWSEDEVFAALRACMAPAPAA